MRQDIFDPRKARLSNWIGAAIGAAASLAGNIIGKNNQNSNIDKQIAAQREENEKNRAWNEAQAEKANQWSIDQWNRENAQKEMTKI